jgi:hypothetical protein
LSTWSDVVLPSFWSAPPSGVVKGNFDVAIRKDLFFYFLFIFIFYQSISDGSFVDNTTGLAVLHTVVDCPCAEVHENSQTNPRPLKVQGVESQAFYLRWLALRGSLHLVGLELATSRVAHPRSLELLTTKPTPWGFYGFCLHKRCMFLVYEYKESESLFCVLTITLKQLGMILLL